jgi:hypothetical protein
MFDSYSLFTDIYNNPRQYLNGTAPLNVTVSASACIFQVDEPETDAVNCTIAAGSDRDSYMW